MAHYDNEIYRGPPEHVPTLSKERHPRASDVYIVKAPSATVTQDNNTTQHQPRPTAAPKKKRLNKIEEAMQFLASCAAAVVIATNVAAAAPTIEEPVSPFPEWPSFSQIDGSVNGLSISTPSQHGSVAQVSTGTKTYRITAKQENLHLFWNVTYSTRYDSNREGFGLTMENLNEGWWMDLSFYRHPQTSDLMEDELPGQFTTEAGEVFYLRAVALGGEEDSKQKIQDVLGRLSDYIEVSEVTEDDWGKVLVGHTMYSDTNERWNGILTTPDVSPSFDFSRINYRKYAGYSEDNFIRSLTINDIEWSFYYSFGEYSPMLWAVPAQEDIALGAGLDYILEELGLTIQELTNGSQETTAVLMDHLGIAVELAAKHCFSNYHLYDNPNWSPSAPPDSPDEPPTVPAPDTGIEDYVYWSGTDFHFAGRSFIMEGMREDAIFREVYKGEDNIQFDVRVDYDDVRVLLIIGTNPNGAEYYPYALDNGQELYIAAFNYWDNARLLDEATLHALARDFASYFKITEITEPGENVPPPADDPYSDLPEYTQYIVTSGGMTYSPLARSNRVCHFSTNGGNYRLDAQTPDMFMLWENYYYDLKEESANSYITLHNIADSWSMGVWVFDEQVESVYDCFTLTTEDGTTLWFYIAHFDDFSQQNPLEAVLSQLPDQIHLSHAEEGNWTKVLYGESLIVDVTSSWSGLAYTANNDDFWYFGQLISSNDLQSYDLRFAESRTVNGTTWDFYTTGSSAGYGITEGKEFYDTQLFAVPTGGDVCFTTSLYNGLTLDQNEFSNQTEYEAYIDANVHLAIDTIVSQGLSNFHLYQSLGNVPSDPTDPYIDEEFYLDKSAYDWINEYSSYDPTPGGSWTHRCHAWSNRTCQFHVNGGAYRLEAMTPEVFICWEDYSYDTEDQLGVSRITIRRLTGAWYLDTWVSDNPEHLASADFSLTMEDGTQLWFYVWHHYSPADPLQDIIQRIENYVKLSPPREDGWNKVRIGQTMISDMNMQWNGLTSTVGTSWCIDQLLSREAASEYAPQLLETRTVNGITWNFYTASSDVFAVPQQEDIWLLIPLRNILDYSQRFRNQNEFTAYYNANISRAIDQIVNEGLIYYHLYP